MSREYDVISRNKENNFTIIGTKDNDGKRDKYILAKEMDGKIVKIDECQAYPDVEYHISQVEKGGYYSIARGNANEDKALMKVLDNGVVKEILANAHDPSRVDENHIMVIAEQKTVNWKNEECYHDYSLLLKEDGNKLSLESIANGSEWYEKDAKTGKMMVYYNNTMPGEEDKPGEFEKAPAHELALTLKENVKKSLEQYNSIIDKKLKFSHGFYQERYGSKQEDIRICKDGKVLLDNAELLQVIDNKHLVALDYGDEHVLSSGLYKFNEKSGELAYLCGYGFRDNIDFEIGKDHIIELGDYMQNDRVANLYSYNGEKAQRIWHGMEKEVRKDGFVDEQLMKQPAAKNAIQNIACGDIDKLMAMKNHKAGLNK